MKPNPYEAAIEYLLSGGEAHLSNAAHWDECGEYSVAYKRRELAKGFTAAIAALRDYEKVKAEVVEKEKARAVAATLGLLWRDHRDEARAKLEKWRPLIEAAGVISRERLEELVYISRQQDDTTLKYLFRAILAAMPEE